MKVYHEIQPDKLQAALTNGLACTSRGDKGDDTSIIKTDQFLDAHRPHSLTQHGVSRDNNLYAYVRVDESVIDITDGEHIPIDTFLSTRAGRVLELDVDPNRCFVSDLDTYDALKSAIEQRKNHTTLEQLAKSYWNKVTKLSRFDSSTMRRPEIMITYDISPHHLTILVPKSSS